MTVPRENGTGDSLPSLRQADPDYLDDRAAAALLRRRVQAGRVSQAKEGGAACRIEVNRRC